MKPLLKPLALLSVLLTLSACDAHPTTPAPKPHAQGPAAAGPAKGPHQGRMLEDGPFALELAIFETHVPPEYRAWPRLNGAPLPLAEVQLTVKVTRLGNRENTFHFTPEGDFLRGDGVLHEPHSFSVTVAATHGGTVHTWSYDSFEGRTTIAAPIAESAGIQTEIAGPEVLTETALLYGRIVGNPERRRDVSARFPGLIRTVSKAVGESVRAGDVLATIESNESLREYPVTAPLAGVVTARNANPGEQTGERTLFTITDTSAVFADLSVFPRDRGRVKPGAAVRLRLADGEASAAGKVVRIDVTTGPNQAVSARVRIDTADGAFLPGSFVSGDVAIAAHSVPLAVKTVGLQAFRDFTVVYARVGETYEVRMLELGAQHGEWTEVLDGLEPGERYVTANSYLIKADVEKSGASHDH